MVSNKSEWVLRARASLLSLQSSCLWAQQWEALGERVCLWQHWLLNTVWLMVQAAVSPSGLLSPDSPVKILFLSLFTLPQSHGQGEGEVNHRRAARQLCGCCYSWGEKHTLTWLRGSFPNLEKSWFSEKDVFPSAESIISAICTLFCCRLRSLLLPFAFALFSLVACKSLSRITVTVWPLKSSLVQVQLVQISLYRRQGPTCHTYLFF